MLRFRPLLTMSAVLKPVSAAVDTGSARAAGAALRTFFRLADAWNLSVAEQTTLLGVARTTLYQWKQGKVAPLDRHLLERLSHLFGVPPVALLKIVDNEHGGSQFRIWDCGFRI